MASSPERPQQPDRLDRLLLAMIAGWTMIVAAAILYVAT